MLSLTKSATAVTLVQSITSPRSRPKNGHFTAQQLFWTQQRPRRAAQAWPCALSIGLSLLEFYSAHALSALSYCPKTGGLTIQTRVSIRRLLRRPLSRVKRAESPASSHSATILQSFACVANTEAFQVSRRERKKVEVRFAHMKGIHKLDRLRLRGLSGAKDEVLLTATAQNLRRLAKLIWRPPQPIANARVA